MRGHDIIAWVRFLPTEESGWSKTAGPQLFKCPLEFENEFFECGLHLEGTGGLAPGSAATVPITLLCPELVKPRMSIGSTFTLREGQIKIAEGVVEQILP